MDKLYSEINQWFTFHGSLELDDKMDNYGGG